MFKYWSVFFNEVVGLPLQNSYAGYFWILAAANTFFSYVWYVLETIASVFVPDSFENTK